MMVRKRLFEQTTAAPLREGKEFPLRGEGEIQPDVSTVIGEIDTKVIEVFELLLEQQL